MLQEWITPQPSRRPDIFPEWEKLETPLPKPMPGDPEVRSRCISLQLPLPYPALASSHKQYRGLSTPSSARCVPAGASTPQQQLGLGSHSAGTFTVASLQLPDEEEEEEKKKKDPEKDPEEDPEKKPEEPAPSE